MALTKTAAPVTVRAVPAMTKNRPQTVALNSSAIRLSAASYGSKIRLPAAPDEFIQAFDRKGLLDVKSADFER